MADQNQLIKSLFDDKEIRIIEDGEEGCNFTIPDSNKQYKYVTIMYKVRINSEILDTECYDKILNISSYTKDIFGDETEVISEGFVSDNDQTAFLTSLDLKIDIDACKFKHVCNMNFLSSYCELVALTSKSVIKQDIVYFIHKHDENKIKVGITNNLMKRVTSISNSNGCKINLIGVIHDKHARNLEKRILKKYKQYTDTGEWISIDNVIAYKIIQENNGYITSSINDAIAFVDHKRTLI